MFSIGPHFNSSLFTELGSLKERHCGTFINVKSAAFPMLSELNSC